jgi:Tfp pilus assembly protein PilV
MDSFSIEKIRQTRGEVRGYHLDGLLMQAQLYRGVKSPGDAISDNIQRYQRGALLIECLVSIVLLGITLASASQLIAQCIRANSVSRSSVAMHAEAQALIDRYRAMPFVEVLDLFETEHLAIADGQAVSQEISAPAARAVFTITLTARRNHSRIKPEAVHVHVSTRHRKAGAVRDYTFETIIAGVT